MNIKVAAYDITDLHYHIRHYFIVDFLSAFL